MKEIGLFSWLLGLFAFVYIQIINQNKDDENLPT